MEENKVLDVIEENNNSSDLIDTIAQLKKNTVSRELYEKEKAEKRELLQKVLNNESIDVTNSTKEDRSTKQIAEEFFDESLSNRDKAVLALEYRNKVIEEKGPSADPFVNQSEFSKPTQADYLEAEHIAEGLQYLVDNSETDEDFRIEANRIFR